MHSGQCGYYHSGLWCFIMAAIEDRHKVVEGVHGRRYTNLSVASCRLRVVGCELSVDIGQLRVDICQLSVASCELSVDICQL